MSQTPPMNPFGAPAPGRVVVEIESYPMPDGSVREKRMTKTTVLRPDGVPVTNMIVEIVPPLACSCLPKDMHEIVQCTGCKAAVCKSLHAFLCQQCGQWYCLRCRVRVSLEGSNADLCQVCADEVMTPAIIRKLRSLIWGEP